MARYKFCFWLNGDKDDELLVAETVDELKSRRLFSSVIRDGIMIVNELRQGRVDLLLRLYPWIVDAIADMLPPPPAPPTPPIDMTPIYDELRRFMAEQGRGIPDTRDGGFPAMSGLMPAPKLAAGQGSTIKATVALPVFDDDDEDTIVLSKSSGKSNGENLKAALFDIMY